jgi:hypothetical protein
LYTFGLSGVLQCTTFDLSGVLQCPTFDLSGVLQYTTFGLSGVLQCTTFGLSRVLQSRTLKNTRQTKSIQNINRHDITEILLKVALNTKQKQTNKQSKTLSIVQAPKFFSDKK